MNLELWIVLVTKIDEGCAGRVLVDASCCSYVTNNAVRGTLPTELGLLTSLNNLWGAPTSLHPLQLVAYPFRVSLFSSLMRVVNILRNTMFLTVSGVHDTKGVMNSTWSLALKLLVFKSSKSPMLRHLWKSLILKLSGTILLIWTCSSSLSLWV